MMHLEILNQLAKTHEHYVQTIHRFKDPAFGDAFRAMLGREGNLSNGPFLEVLPSYSLGRATASVFNEGMSAPLDKPTISALHPHPDLYWHQEESIRRMRAGRNVVVASGTGSGKTEAFMLPILLHLYGEALAGTLRESGIRALVLYPLNALSNDQLDRLKETSERLRKMGSAFTFTYGQYTGETPQNRADERRGGETKESQRRRGEMVFRDEMHVSPPHILLTNYSMLEYLLLRPDDSPLFDHGASKHWRFIVLDEAHQYSGTQGTEIGLLVRRLKQRLREGGRQGGFTCVATSATMMRGEEDVPMVASFASDLFGEPFSPEDVIRGKTRALPLELAKSAGGPDDPQWEAFVRRVHGRVLRLETVQQELRLSPESLEAYARRLADLQDPVDGQVLTTVRYHLFVRGIPSLYVSYFPDPDVATKPPPESRGAWFSTALCTRCGQHYLEGNVRDGRLHEPFERPLETSQNSLFFLPVTTPEPGRTDYWVVNTRDGRIRSPLEQPEESITWQERLLLERLEPGSYNERGTPSECLVCGFRSREPIRTPRLEIMEPQSLLALSLHRSLPKERNRILAFADGRQDAARFAVECQSFADDAMMRGMLLGILERKHREGVDGHSVQDLMLLLQQELLKLKNQAYRGERAKLEAARFLLREALNPQDNANLMNVGLVAVDLALPVGTIGPSRWQAELGINQLVAIDLLGRLYNACLADKSIDVEALQSGVTWQSLEFGFPSHTLVLGGVDKRRNVVSWDSASGRRAKTLQRILAELGIPESGVDLGLMLDEAFESLRAARDDFEQPLLIAAGNGDQASALQLWFTYLRLPHQQCVHCGCRRITGPLSTCIQNSCRGTFAEVPANTPETDPFLPLYLQPSTTRFEIEEHTAQISKIRGRLYQERFKEGKIQALSSSTTFELGVDLGSLDAVFLRNVPPEPFNYAQRVGRVGRRKGFPGIVLVFARQRSHDYYHFTDPTVLMEGKVKPPVLSLKNMKIVDRHFAAMALSKYFREHPGDLDSTNTLLKTGKPNASDALRDYVDQHRPMLQECMAAAFGDIPEASRELERSDWLHRMYGAGSVLRIAEDEYNDEMTELLRLEQEAMSARDGKLLDWSKRRQQTLTEEPVISFLARKSVIPKYGFPVDVVSLDTQPARSGGVEDDVSLQRDLSFAITEYAPGNEIVANKQGWTSVAIKRVRHREWPLLHYQACPLHGLYEENTDRSKLSEAQCCRRSHRGTYIVPAYGFLARPDSAKRPSHYRKFVARSQPFFVRIEGQDTWTQSASGRIRLSAASPGDMVVVGTKADYGAYRICKDCGLELGAPRGRRGQPDGHLPPTLRDGSGHEWRCRGASMEVHLAHRFRTTVIRFRFPDLPNLPSTEEDAAVYYVGLGTAISLSAAEVLQVPSREIGYTIAKDSTGVSDRILVFYDTAPGGAGLVERLAHEKVLRETLGLGARRTNGSCRCGAGASCYSCLRTYGNQYWHPFLRRGEIHDALQSLVDGFSDDAGKP